MQVCKGVPESVLDINYFLQYIVSMQVHVMVVQSNRCTRRIDYCGK